MWAVGAEGMLLYWGTGSSLCSLCQAGAYSNNTGVEFGALFAAVDYDVIGL